MNCKGKGKEKAIFSIHERALCKADTGSVGMGLILALVFLC